MKFITKSRRVRNFYVNEARRQRRIQIALGERKNRLRKSTFNRITYHSDNDVFQIELETDTGQIKQLQERIVLKKLSLRDEIVLHNEKEIQELVALLLDFSQELTKNTKNRILLKVEEEQNNAKTEKKNDADGIQSAHEVES